MKITIELLDDNLADFLKILEKLPYARINNESISSKGQERAEILEAVEEMKLIVAGHKEANDAEIFLNGL